MLNNCFFFLIVLSIVNFPSILVYYPQIAISYTTPQQILDVHITRLSEFGLDLGQDLATVLIIHSFKKESLGSGLVLSSIEFCISDLRNAGILMQIVFKSPATPTRPTK